MTPVRAAVLGAGSWGTTFSLLLADAGSRVSLWCRRPGLAAAITADHANEEYLPGVRLPDAVTATSDVARALAGAGVVVLALPSQRLREHLREWSGLLPPHVPVVSLMKGIELGTLRRMSEVVTEVAGVAPQRVVAVSGPNLAREIADRQPAAGVVACPDHDVAEQVARLCATPAFRPYTVVDVVGTEVGGAVKNVIALAVGMAEGLGLGDNSRASLITRGLAETTRLGLALGADPQTLAGLAGVGDLVATCSSPLSRNRTAGQRLGRGATVAQVTSSTRQNAEGLTSCLSVLELAAAAGVDMPIVASVVDVVHHGTSPAQTGARLLLRARRREAD